MEAGREDAAPFLGPLPPVRVEADRVIRTTVGLRPYRPGGFVVEAERLDGTLLIHHYGHGGGGMTLSWGTAHLALELLEGSGVAGPGDAGTRPRAAVLGSGVIGLSTARLLQRRGFHVTIYARDLPPNTTSDRSGASWSPSMVVERSRVTPAFRVQLERAERLSNREFQVLAGDPRYGVRWREQYRLTDEEPRGSEDTGFAADAGVAADVGNAEDAGVAGGSRAAARGVTIGTLYPDPEIFGPGRHPFPTRYAVRDHTMFIEPHLYLRALLEDVRVAGGDVVVRTFHDPSEVRALPQPVVFNCTGLGARELFGDDDLVPVRGQLVFLLPQPEVEYAVLAPGFRYMFPRGDGILLGGTSERGVESLEPDPAATERILRAHAQVFGAMEGVTAPP